MYAVGKHLLEKQCLKNTLFNVFSIAAIIVSGMLPGVLLLDTFYNSGYISQHGGFVLAVGYWIAFLVSSMELSRITVNYERKKKPDYHYRSIDKIDYISRFMSFLYLPFSIWFYQSIVNGYLAEETV